MTTSHYPLYYTSDSRLILFTAAISDQNFFFLFKKSKLSKLHADHNADYMHMHMYHKCSLESNDEIFFFLLT